MRNMRAIARDLRRKKCEMSQSNEGGEDGLHVKIQMVNWLTDEEVTERQMFDMHVYI